MIMCSRDATVSYEAITSWIKMQSQIIIIQSQSKDTLVRLRAHTPLFLLCMQSCDVIAIVQPFGKYTNSHYCREMDEKIDILLMCQIRQI